MDHTGAAGMVAHIADYTAAVNMAVDMVAADTVAVDIVTADNYPDCTDCIAVVDIVDIVKGRIAAADIVDMAVHIAVANTVADYTAPVDKKGLNFADTLDMLAVEAVGRIE